MKCMGPSMDLAESKHSATNDDFEKNTAPPPRRCAAKRAQAYLYVVVSTVHSFVAVINGFTRLVRHGAGQLFFFFHGFVESVRGIV